MSLDYIQGMLVRARALALGRRTEHRSLVLRQYGKAS
jgi:hypothetical protein